MANPIIEELDLRHDAEEEYVEFSEEEESITAQKVLENVETAWINERLAPDILKYEEDMMELIIGQISHLEGNMKELDKTDFRCIAHQMELDRIRYIVTSYLRCRLKKIENYTKNILNEEEKLPSNQKRLSSEELRFAHEYNENLEQHFQQVALQYMPTMSRSDIDQRTVRPNLKSHVFIKANKTVPSVVVGGTDDEEVDLVEGSQHIIPYHLVADLIAKGDVKLI